MLKSSARLLRLLSLLEVRRDWSGDELAGRLGVDKRTVRRDVERLRSLGYPVRSTPGIAGGYRLGPGAHLPPLLLDDDEAVAVAVSLRTAALTAIGGIEESSVRALTKLDQLLPATLRQRVQGLESVTLAIGAAPATVDAAILTRVAAAARNHERLRFEYEDHDGAASTRTTEPCGLACTGRRWYLLAWDLDRQDWRTFRVDRIGSVLNSGPQFEPRDPPEDVATFVRRSISVHPYRYQARVTLHAALAELAQRVPYAAALLTPLDSASCLLETGTDSLMWLAVVLAEFGADFEVHDPPELLDHLCQVAGRMGRALGSRTG